MTPLDLVLIAGSFLLISTLAAFCVAKFFSAMGRDLDEDSEGSE